jgi:hypothetical protein
MPSAAIDVGCGRLDGATHGLPRRNGASRRDIDLLAGVEVCADAQQLELAFVETGRDVALLRDVPDELFGQIVCEMGTSSADH